MKKNKKIIIIIISILLIISIIGLVLYLSLSKDKKDNNLDLKEPNENKETIEDNKPIEYKYTEDGPGFVCSNKELYANTLNYDKGEYVYCEIGFELDGNNPGITEIWFENTHDDDIEYIEIKDIFENWKLDSKDGIIHLKSDTPITFGDGLYKVKFRIIPSTQKEKLQISFKNIKYKTANEEYYQTDDSVVELSINKETNYQYKLSEKHDEIILYKFDKTKGYEEINKYKCQNENCYEYASQCTSYIDRDNGKMFIHDGDKAILYDFNKGIIGTYQQGIDMIDKYFIVQDPKTKKYGIIDLAGKTIKELTSDGFGNKVGPCFNKDTYSLEHNQIVEKKDNKYGIVKITKDEVIINHDFDDIRLFNDKYFKAKQEDKWYLYSIDNKEKVLEEGYKELFIINNEIIITQIEDNLYIKDYQGNNIIEDKIKVLLEYNEGACCGTTSGINIELENGIINISIAEKQNEKDYDYIFHKYEYNIKDKKLTKTK